MSILALRSAVSFAGGTPTQFNDVGLLRQLITAWGGTPTQWSVVGLLREAITTVGGTPTQYTPTNLLRELVIALNNTPVSYDPDVLWTQIAGLASLSPTLRQLALSNTSHDENAAPGVLIGNILNLTVGSTLSLLDSAGNRVALSGTNLVVGATSTNYEVTTSYSITLREALTIAGNTPNDTIIVISVNNLSDTNPSAFTFTDVTNVSVGTTQTSNLITVAGLGASDNITAVLTGDSTSELSVNGGGWSAGPVPGLFNGDTIRVRHTSSALNSTTVNTVLTLGTASDTFSSTTAVSTVTLQTLALFNNAFNENAAAGTVIGAVLNLTSGSALTLTGNASNKVALSGTNLTVGATNSDYETVGASFTCQLTETLAGATGSPKATTLTIALGNLNDTNPSAFSFTAASDVAVTTPQTSNSITIAGLGASDSATATISGAASSELSVNGGAFTSAATSVVNGDTIRVRHTSADSATTATTTTLTVGTTSSTFTSTTASPAVLPAGVITQTSPAGTNPPLWDAVMSGLQDGDTVQLDFTSDGSSPDGTAEESKTIVSTDESLTWSTFTGFAGGATVKWRQRYGRIISGSQVWAPWSNTLSDVMTVVASLWTPETPPAGQNIAFASSSATFSAINFGVGMGVVLVSSTDRRITSVTVGGSAATKVSESSTGTRGVSMWRIDIASAGSKTVVIAGASGLGHVAIATGTMTPGSTTPTAIATPKAYGYTSDPQALASLTIPSGGIALCALISENVTATVTWSSGCTKETDRTEGANSAGVRITTASRTATGVFSLTGLSTQGSAMVAAAWSGSGAAAGTLNFSAASQSGLLSLLQGY